MRFKLFDLYDMDEVGIEDPGLKRVVNLDAKLIPKSHGRDTKEFGKIKVNVVERLIRLLQVPGSRGKKHKIMTPWASGKYEKKARIVLEALKIIEEKKKMNPVQVLVKAIENGCPKDEVTSIEYGGARYPQAVDTSPIRRLNLVLRYFVHGSYDKAFRSKTSIESALANEIILAADKSPESFAIKKKTELEKQADAAR